MPIERSSSIDSSGLVRAVRAYNRAHFERGSVPDVLMVDEEQRPLSNTLDRNVQGVGVDLNPRPNPSVSKQSEATVSDNQLGGVYGYIPGVPG